MPCAVSRKENSLSCIDKTMYSENTIIVNSTGLHARPASEFVSAAKRFQSKITVQNLDDPSCTPVNAKSIVLLLAEGLAKGTHIQISASGEDEKAAVTELIALVASGFGE